MLEARPIVVNPDMIVLGGNMRLKAAKAAGLTEAPVYVATWEESKAKEFIVKDNVGFGEWDWDILANEWDAAELDEWGLDVWQPEEEEKEGLTDPDEVPEAPEEPKTKLGDLYILGDHRLLCGDSTKAEDVEKLMNGEKADSIITSPPYNQGNGEGDLFHHGKKKVKLYDGECQDNMSAEQYFIFLTSVLNVSFDFLNELHSVVWNVSYNAKSRGDYGKIVFSDKNPFSVCETIIWDKKASINLSHKGIYSRRCELVFIMSAGEKYLTSQNKGECRWNYFEISKEKQYDDGEIQHRATFPINFADRCLKDFTINSSLVYEPFAGSGTVLISCEKNKRISRNMELDPKYCDVIVKRWEDFTGKKAELWKQ